MSDLEANKQVLRDAIDAMSRLDAEGFLRFLSDDVVFETPGASPVSGKKTKDEIRKEFPALRDALPHGIKFTILTMTAEGDRVHMEMAGEAKTVMGEDYNNRYHYATVIRNGKIVEFRDYLDHDLVLRLLLPAFERNGAVKADRERDLPPKSAH